MSTETVLELSITVFFFFFGSYFIFYKSWLKAFGSEFAKLNTAKDLTQITEKVKKDFNESIESYKSKLSEELSSKIEPLKAELNKQNISYQIQYSFLHQERSKVLVELYKKMVELNSAMIDWTATMHPVINNADEENQARGIRYDKAFADFKNYYLLNKIYFAKSFCIPIDDLINEFWDKGWNFGFAKNQVSQRNLPPDYFKEYAKELSSISKEIKDVIPPKIAEIEDLCRKILNVEEE